MSKMRVILKKEAKEVEAARCTDGRRYSDLKPFEIQKRTLNILSLVQDSSLEQYENAPVDPNKVAIKNGSLFGTVVKFSSFSNCFSSHLALRSRLITSPGWLATPDATFAKSHRSFG